MIIHTLKLEIKSQVSKLENKNYLAINVFGFVGNRIIIHHISKMNPCLKRINLMLTEEGDKFYYTFIKDFNKLLFDQSKHEHRKFFCENCLTGYTTKEFLGNHKKNCNGVGKN